MRLLLGCYLVYLYEQNTFMFMPFGGVLLQSDLDYVSILQSCFIQVADCELKLLTIVHDSL